MYDAKRLDEPTTHTDGIKPECMNVRAEAKKAHLIKAGKRFEYESIAQKDYLTWQGRTEDFLKSLPKEPIFDLVVTSPPYNIGKSYEKKTALEEYLEWQKTIIDQIIPRIKTGGSICWQVGNFVEDNQIFPLDIEFAPIFKQYPLHLRNRIVWHFGHGLHTQRRFSGRYEVVLWYTKTDSAKDPYVFNLYRYEFHPSTRGKNTSRDQKLDSSLATHLEKIRKTSGPSPMSKATTLKKPTIPANTLWD